jgi:hypothetical protein
MVRSSPGEAHGPRSPTRRALERARIRPTEPGTWRSCQRCGRASRGSFTGNGIWEPIGRFAALSPKPCDESSRCRGAPAGRVWRTRGAGASAASCHAWTAAAGSTCPAGDPTAGRARLTLTPPRHERERVKEERDEPGSARSAQLAGGDRRGGHLLRDRRGLVLTGRVRTAVDGGDRLGRIAPAAGDEPGQLRRAGSRLPRK